MGCPVRFQRQRRRRRRLHLELARDSLRTLHLLPATIRVASPKTSRAIVRSVARGAIWSHIQPKALIAWKTRTLFEQQDMLPDYFQGLSSPSVDFHRVDSRIWLTVSNAA